MSSVSLGHAAANTNDGRPVIVITSRSCEVLDDPPDGFGHKIRGDRQPLDF